MTTPEREIEDMILRDLLASSASYANLENDTTLIAIDINTMKWLTAKQINDKDDNA